MSRPRSIRTCSIPFCTAKHVGKGLCAKHYMRLRNNGTLELRNNRHEHHRLITFNDVTKTINEWAADVGICYNAMANRLRHWSLENALTSKSNQRSSLIGRTHKTCSDCKIEKPLDAYHFKTGTVRQGKCKECVRIYARNHGQNNRVSNREYQRKYRINLKLRLTEEEYAAYNRVLNAKRVARRRLKKKATRG